MVKKLLCPKYEEKSTVDMNEWVLYFSKLYNNKTEHHDKQFHEYVKNTLPVLEKTDNNKECKINSEDVVKNVKELKNNKSSGLDYLLNEMLKCTIDITKDTITSVFNEIIKSGKYPECWQNSILVPIHKKGSKSIPENYRGLSITSCLSKLLNKILCKKIDLLMKEKQSWSKYQNGFRTDCRTEDNLFILNSIVSKYHDENKRVYVAYVDFTKFFDTINRDLLLYKLISYGINGNLYKILKSMYTNTSYVVKTDNYLSESFVSNSGVKQGCNLSPILSNIYQNDMYKIFDETCEPVVINNLTNLNMLSWADDLILLSESAKGLQKCLDRLERYCFKWGLNINNEKNKCMIFTKIISQNKDHVFFYKNEKLDIVNEYTYLGFKIKSNNRIKSVMQDRIEKASRVANVLRKCLYTTNNVNFELALNLFDKQVIPTLLYGASIWAVPQQTNYLYVENIPIGINNVNNYVKEKFCNILKKQIHVKVVKKIITENKKMFKVLVNVENHNDKEELLYRNNKSLKVTNYELNPVDTVYEKVHTMFCKFVLNISKYSSNMATLGELCRYPLYIKAIKQCINYWCRLENGTENILLNEMYVYIKEKKNWWLQGIYNILKYNGFGNKINEVNNHCNINNSFINEFVQRLKDCHTQSWFSKTQNSDKLKHLPVLYQNQYCRKDYVNIIKNVNVKKNVIKLRTAAYHSKCGTLNKHENNLCEFCNNDNESLYHILLKCKEHNNMRNELFIHCNIMGETDDFKIKFLLNFEKKNERFHTNIINYLNNIIKKCKLF